MWTEQQRARQQEQTRLCAGISVHRACNATFPIAAVAPLQSTLPPSWQLPPAEVHKIGLGQKHFFDLLSLSQKRSFATALSAEISSLGDHDFEG